MLFPRLLDGDARLRVGHTAAKQIALHGRQIRGTMQDAGFIHPPAIDRHEPGQVAGMPHVHRVGQAVSRRLDFPIHPRREKVGEFIVAIHRHHQPAQRQPHPPGDDRAHHVAEIAAGYGKDDRFSGRSDPRGCIKVIDALRQQPADVDGIGGGQSDWFQHRIGKGALHHRLAIVKLPVHGNGPDVVAQRGHLFALAVADLVEWEQHDDPDPFHPMKRTGHRRTRVAAGRRQDGQGGAGFADETADEPGHQARGEILERRGGAAIKPQDVDPVPPAHRDQRHFVIVGLLTYRGQGIVRHHARAVFRQHAEGDFRIRQRGKPGEFRGCEGGKLTRQIETLVRRLADQQRRAQIGGRGLFVGAEKLDHAHPLR
ncbi:MAG: hypothetical protein BWX84_02526 [Verrucomicrobia bacterium ADurb.Bin118]|nr:MAG: hypothetical protein BWX84_02526 [Verrucomicrobia bacterium ADurb.Bin118]